MFAEAAARCPTAGGRRQRIPPTHSRHPPAGASALIVALGILRTAEALAVIFGAVVLVTALAWAFNRLTGVNAPVWSPRNPDAEKS